MRRRLHSRNCIPIPQFKIKAKLGRFIAARFSPSFYHKRCRRLSLPPRNCNSFETPIGRRASTWSEERSHHHDCVVLALGQIVATPGAFAELRFVCGVLSALRPPPRRPRRTSRRSSTCSWLRPPQPQTIFMKWVAAESRLRETGIFGNQIEALHRFPLHTEQTRGSETKEWTESPLLSASAHNTIPESVGNSENQ